MLGKTSLPALNASIHIKCVEHSGKIQILLNNSRLLPIKVGQTSPSGKGTLSGVMPKATRVSQ